MINTDKADGIGIKFANGDLYPLHGVAGSHSYVHKDTGVEAKFTIDDGQIALTLYGQQGMKVESKIE